MNYNSSFLYFWKEEWCPSKNKSWSNSLPTSHLDEVVRSGLCCGFYTMLL